MTAGGDSRGAADRSDLLAILAGLERSGVRIGRADRWRRRSRSAKWVAREAGAVAAALVGRGVSPGDRVALHLTDGPLWHSAFFGILRAGAVAVPLDTGLEPGILREIAGDLDLAAWCTELEVPDLELAGVERLELDWRRPLDADRPPPQWPPDDPDRTAEIVLTSGTTGAPQAVPVTHANLRAVLDGLAGGIEEYRWALRVAPKIRIAAALPLSHLYGQTMGAFVPALVPADAILLPPMPAPDLARALADERAWVLATVPRTLELLGRHLKAEGEAIWGAERMRRRLESSLSGPWWRRPAVFWRLRKLVGRRLVAVVSGGAALDREVEDLWRALGYVVVQGYGLTETAPLVTLAHPFDTRPGSLGRPLPGVEIRISPDGEILVRGPNVVAARLGGRATDDEGWLHTGDLGRWEEGRLVYLGRKGERIVTPAGVNVDPAPVSDRLRSEPGILDAIVLERPWGERGIVAAVLALAPGADAPAAVGATNRELPDAARIRSWHAWPEADFPRTRTGKPRRAEILGWLRSRAPDEAADRTPLARAEEPPGTPADAFTALARIVAEIGGVPADELERSTPIGDVLGSLDRIELISRLETTYGAAPGPEDFGPDRTLGELADDLLGPRGRVAEGAREANEPSTAAEVYAAAAERGAENVSAPTSGPPRRFGRAEGPEAEPRAAPGTRRGLGRRLERVPESRWRFAAPVRVTRYAFRTALLRPFWRSFFAMDVAGREHLSGLDPPFLVAANHLSELDPGAVLFGLSPRMSGRIATTAMWEYFPGARTGPALYALGVWGLNLIPLVQFGDWRPTLRIAGAVADRGGCPIVYPEGERSTDGELLPFQKGVAVMARELHLPIVPCGAAGLLAVLPKGSHWARNCWFGRAPVAVRFGPPLPVPRPDDDPDVLLAEIERRIERLTREARAASGRF